MRSYRECPSCRALLTEEQLTASDGACPYCGRKIPLESDAGADHDVDNPYAPPQAPFRHQTTSPAVPRGLGGKLAMAGVLLAEQLPLFAALVLTIWLPGNALLEMAMAAGPNPGDPRATMAMMRMSMLIGSVFSPIYTAGIITALAARMNGERVSYVEAMRSGLHHWARLLAARFVAGLLIFLGFVCLIVPGIILAVRYMLIDDVVVLEGAGSAQSRSRSIDLGRGKGVSLLTANVLAVSLILVTSVLVMLALESSGMQDVPGLSVAGDCLVDVVSAYSICLTFLYYWEARLQERHREDVKPDGTPLEELL